MHCAWPMFRSIKRDIYVVEDISSKFKHRYFDRLATGITKNIRNLPFSLIV